MQVYDATHHSSFNPPLLIGIFEPQGRTGWFGGRVQEWKMKTTVVQQYSTYYQVLKSRPTGARADSSKSCWRLFPSLTSHTRTHHFSTGWDSDSTVSNYGKFLLASCHTNSNIVSTQYTVQQQTTHSTTDSTVSCFLRLYYALTVVDLTDHQIVKQQQQSSVMFRTTDRVQALYNFFHETTPSSEAP